MSAQSGRSKGQRALRVVGAGSGLDAWPAPAGASHAVSPCAQADVIDHFVKTLDASGFVGGGAFQALSGSTEGMCSDVWAMRQAASAGTDFFAVGNADLPLIYPADVYPPARQDHQGLIASVGQNNLGGVGGSGGAGGGGHRHRRRRQWHRVGRRTPAASAPGRSASAAPRN